MRKLKLKFEPGTATLDEARIQEKITMYSVKPGRGPSLMDGIGGILAAVIGVIWTIAALSMGAPGFVALFGVVFVIAAVVRAYVNFFNATQPNRLSNLDITTGEEEPDPIAKALGHASVDREPGLDAASPRRIEGGFCPYCGAALEQDYNFCPKCGKDV
ncbi:MAG: zinc ribbon domain-containing protein [FCB group bacterium]|nr:zinc ribbon domain-containing protein [FCB group bacterium]